MATVNYTTLLGMALPTTGDLSGTWGNEVNSYLTQYVDSAVAGTQTISADTNTTLTVTNGSALGSTSAQYMILNCTGARTAARTITLPASSRHYVVLNATTGGFAVNIVGAGPTTGISVANGERCVIAWNGSDYVKVASTAISNLTGTLGVANGGTGTATAFTAGSVVFAGASGVYSQNNASFFWDNTNGFLGVGTTSPGGKLEVSGSNAGSVLASRILNTSTSASSDAQQFIYVNSGTAGDPYTTWTVGGVTSWSAGIRNSDSDNWYLSPGSSLATSPLLTVTVAGFTRPKAYADTVSALGNTGTATTIDLRNANVFTATLTGNCTFTLSNPIATGSSSFTLILTNDGTAGRTVAWAGGAFRFPGGAASLSRTTTANAVDIWVFFTPDGGTTWYGNIAMKNMAA